MGKNIIGFDLIESQFRHLRLVAVSVREGTISSSTLLKNLRSGSRKNATYAAFRYVGRVIRTVQLLRYLSDAPIRRRVTAAANKAFGEDRSGFWRLRSRPTSPVRGWWGRLAVTPCRRSS
ncbi:Tn3 family transposase [Streptomyces sp. NPDC060333]|uniref:Tn3 family transposase n=1 Tax=Streptomyces sp. NPDC060333 TaxID=3347098 RepID=UPI003646CC37